LYGKVLTNGRINAYKSLALPIGPTNLTAIKASPTQIDLSWSDNSDPAFNEDGFRIERKMGASGSYHQIDTVGQDGTTYSDVLSEEGRYYYRVRAYNSMGNSSYSNEATPPLMGNGGGCFIAAAAFGSSLEHHVQALRDLRDRYLLTSSIGKGFVFLYYRFSPPIADFIAKNEVLRAVVRICLYPAAGFRYIVPHFAHTGNIMLLLGMLGIVAGLFSRVSKIKRKRIPMNIEMGNLDFTG